MSQLVSVIVPCYNQAQYLDECLQSVHNQTYQNWECIIVNDGSPDNTEELAQNWVEKDSRFKYFYKENGGLSSARNFGINKAEGEWILPLDCDDYISDDYLDVAQKHFDNQDLKVIYCEAQKFGEVTGKWVLPEFSLARLAAENLIFCTAFFRKFDWQIVGGYDEKLLIGYEDWEFWINLLKEGGEVVKLANICFYYRTKENSMLVNLKLSENKSAVMYIEKKHLDFFHKHLGSLHSIYYRNEQLENVFDIVIKKRKISKTVNQVYSFFENRRYKKPK